MTNKDLAIVDVSVSLPEKDITTDDRLKAVYVMITAAQALIEDGQTSQARGFLQSARIVASANDDFLQLNRSQVEIDLTNAAKIVADRINARSS